MTLKPCTYQAIYFYLCLLTSPPSLFPNRGLWLWTPYNTVGMIIGCDSLPSLRLAGHLIPCVQVHVHVEEK